MCQLQQLNKNTIKQYYYLKLDSPLNKKLYYYFFKKSIQFLLKDGKYNTARTLLIKSFKKFRILEKQETFRGIKTKLPLELKFLQILKNAKILVEIKKIKIKRFINFYPSLVKTPELQMLKGFQLLVETSKKQPHYVFEERFAQELFNTFQLKSETLSQRNNLHLEALEYRLNVHYRWPAQSSRSVREKQKRIQNFLNKKKLKKLKKTFKLPKTNEKIFLKKIKSFELQPNSQDTYSKDFVPQQNLIQHS